MTSFSTLFSYSVINRCKFQVAGQRDDERKTVDRRSEEYADNGVEDRGEDHVCKHHADGEGCLWVFVAEKKGEREDIDDCIMNARER
ncbi:hypothetical protein IFR04_004041 [Cadophora malorum]|uniref:Uncharacterized protein n=1 Tax=Cadophora malorum TaxID=108018 RepID=A0A8H7WDF9_9HELO|nr:hypothetical protein IFR04_004041 [Cadophora malorum]